MKINKKMHAYMNEYFRAVGLIHYRIIFVLMFKWFQMIKILFLFLRKDSVDSNESKLKWKFK